MIDIDFNPDKAKLKGFAWIAFAFFALWSLISQFKFETPLLTLGLGSLAGYSLFCALFMFRWVKWLYVVMSVVAFPFGWVISNLFLVLTFILLFFPIGLLLKIFGHDPMNRKRKNSETYWKSAKNPRTPESYYHQH